MIKFGDQLFARCRTPLGVVVISPTQRFRSISRAMQGHIGAFFASSGTLVVHPEPARFFEVPVVGPLPEDLNFIL